MPFSINEESSDKFPANDGAVPLSGELSEKTTEKTTEKATEKTTEKTTEKILCIQTEITTNKTADKILKLIAQNPEITSAELSKRCGVSPDGVRYHIRNMKRSKLIVRVGGKKKGYWDVSE